MSDKSHASTRDEFQVLWSALPAPGPVTADQVRGRALMFAASKRRRGIGAAVVVVVGVGQAVASALLFRWPLAPWEWAGVAYLVAFAVVMLWISLAVRPRLSPTMDGVECVRAYRSLLEQERDANQGRALALRVPIPVFALVVQAGLIAMKGNPGVAFWPFAVVALAASGVVWQRGRARARLLQDHIDAVNQSQQD